MQENNEETKMKMYARRDEFMYKLQRSIEEDEIDVARREEMPEMEIVLKILEEMKAKDISEVCNLEQMRELHLYLTHQMKEILKLEAYITDRLGKLINMHPLRQKVMLVKCVHLVSYLICQCEEVEGRIEVVVNSLDSLPDSVTSDLLNNFKMREKANQNKLPEEKTNNVSASPEEYKSQLDHESPTEANEDTQKLFSEPQIAENDENIQLLSTEVAPEEHLSKFGGSLDSAKSDQKVATASNHGSKPPSQRSISAPVAETHEERLQQLKQLYSAEANSMVKEIKDNFENHKVEMTKRVKSVLEKKSLLTDTKYVAVSILKTLNQDYSSFSVQPLHLMIPYCMIAWFILSNFFAALLPVFARGTFGFQLRYIEVQNNVLLAYFFRSMLLFVIESFLIVYSRSNISEIIKTFGLSNIPYSQTFVFYGLMSTYNLFDSQSMTQNVLDSIIFEIFGFLDSIAEVLHEKANDQLFVTLRESSSQGQDRLEETILPNHDALFADYCLVTMTSLFISSLICLAWWWETGTCGPVLSTAVFTLSHYFCGCIQLRKLRQALQELCLEKKLTKTSLWMNVMRQFYPLVTVLIASVARFKMKFKGVLTWKQNLMRFVSISFMALLKLNPLKSISGIIRSKNLIYNFKEMSVGSHKTNPVDCCICLDSATRPVLTRCHHMFHWNCIVTWYLYNSQQCPICRNIL